MSSNTPSPEGESTDVDSADATQSPTDSHTSNSSSTAERSPIGKLSPDSTAHWSNIFPFDSPYDNQTNGIESILETGREHGFTLIEGACGTGKTLMALTAGLSLLRNPDSNFKRILAITSVKQQMAAFEDDLQAINDAARDGRLPIKPVTATALVGKGDICPYSSAGDLKKEDVYSTCQSLRENTKNMVTNEEGNLVDEALQIVQNAERVADTAASLDGVDAPFGRTPLEYPEASVCPFYAQYLADSAVDDQSIPTEGRVLNREALRRDAIKQGSCPHAVMTDQITNAEVVIGNYYHVFDPLTRDALVDPIIDDETILIVDEAHMLVDRVRDLLSDSASHTGLKNASDECRTVLDYLAGSEGAEHKTVAEQILTDTPVGREDIEQFNTILNGIASWLETVTTGYFEQEHADKAPPYVDIDDEEIPLRDPETPRTDDLTQQLQADGYDLELLSTADKIGEVVGDILGTVRAKVEDKTGDGVKHAPGAGRLLHAWMTNNHEEYFREIRLLDRGYVSDHFDMGWKATHKAKLYLNNCIPSGKIASRLDEFGAGVLMSATLAPIDMYEETVGLNFLTDRPTRTEMFPLRFPTTNRDSIAVDLPPFSYKHRGPAFPTEDRPRSPEQDAVREKYVEAMAAVCSTTPGNVLLVMPSYAECRWATSELERHPDVEKPLLRDESSSDTETTVLKNKFFDGDGKILLTSARGTLTEGVDYADDRLDAVAVIGVPIVSTAGIHNTALETAYENRYGEGAGFVYAFTIPAVWKARQAVGRVIRNSDDVGVRVLLDGRYTQTSSAGGKVYPYIPKQVYQEYDNLEPEDLADRLAQFWT